MGEIEKMTLESESLIDDRLNKLKELMPEVFSESGIDFDKLRLELGDERVSAWLRGEEIEAKTAQKGFAAVLCDGFPLGFGKCSGGKCKNRYPKGLRNLK